MSAGFCETHQMYLNEFGWCDGCGEPVAVIRPPLALADSVLDISDGFSTDDEGRIIPERFIRSCTDSIHVYAAVPGECQCGAHFWNGDIAEAAR